MKCQKIHSKVSEFSSISSLKIFVKGHKNNFMHFKPRQKKRLFIGIPITDELKNKLENGIQQNISLPFYRWVPKENYHVTTLFLGSVNEKEIDQARQEGRIEQA